MHRVARSDPKTAQGIHHSYPPYVRKTPTDEARAPTHSEALLTQAALPEPNRSHGTALRSRSRPFPDRRTALGTELRYVHWPAMCCRRTTSRRRTCWFRSDRASPPRGRSRTTPRHGHSRLVDSLQDDRASTKFTHRHAAQPPPGQHSSGRHRTCNDRRARRSCKRVPQSHLTRCQESQH